MGQEETLERIEWLMDEIRPLTQHNDFRVYPFAYKEKNDTLFLDVVPVSGPEWAKVAHRIARQGGMRYNRDTSVYHIDGQPRCSYGGQVWAGYVGDFLDGSRVALRVWSQQPSHRDAEDQLSSLYARFVELDGLEPIEVFQKYL